MNANLLDKIAAEPSLKGKKALLKDADPGTFGAIQLALDPFMTFGITVPENAYGLVADEELDAGDATLYGIVSKALPARAGSEDAVVSWWNSGVAMMQCLSDRKLTGRAASDAAEQWLRASPSSAHAKWAARVLNKNLRMGVNVSLFVSVFPGAVSPFAVALAFPYDPHKHDIAGHGYVEPKLDGLRCTIIGGKAYSRGGIELPSLQHIVDDLGQAAHDWVWDGEALDPNATFESTSGRIRRRAPKESDTSLKFFAFDLVERSEWEARATCEFSDRRAELEYVMGDLRPQHTKLVPSYQVNNPTMSDLIEVRNRFMQDGYEGAMWKAAGRPYEFRRSDAVLKIKVFDTMDVRILDTVEGEGKHVGRLGAIVVRGPLGESFNVGTGFSDEERRQLWQIRSTLVGRYAEIRQQQRAASGAKSTFASFVRLRPDKD